MVKEEVARVLERALDRCARDGLLPAGERPPVQLDAPRNPAHGDFASNAAMVLQKQHAQATGAAKPNPRALAQAIVERIEDPDRILEKVEIAGPGFLNLKISPVVWHRAVGAVWQERDRFGRSAAGGRRKTMVEFVSANPTGPMHVGHGRGAVIGDTVAHLLDWVGYDVFREFYANDAGGQVFRLAHAVYARATELDGNVPLEPLDPDDYQGEYVKDVARAWLATRPDLRKPFSELREPLRQFATGWILDHLIKPDLELFGIRFDRFFSEKTLHDKDAIPHAVEVLRSKGVLAEEVLPPPQGTERDPDEEATPKPLLVMKTTRFGDDRDRPIYKTTGEPTYFAADLAYHFDKLERGYRRLIDVWGADHGGYLTRMKAAVGAMGGELEVIIVQLVNLLKEGKPFKMSKRAANFVTLREVLEEAGADATRFFFLLRRADMALDFDVALARKNTLDNPVFYVQYGHARCAAILRKAQEERAVSPTYDLDTLSALKLPEEMDLIKRVLHFPDLVAAAAQSLEPHRIVFYLQETIAAFHAYYTKYKKTERVISDDARKTAARLYLVWAIKQTLRNALALLGVSAPERMEEAEKEPDAV
ncbi:MAG: arginine--tRNA ligase [Deltaproteobacteria bacterium]|nr:MAG: arginine--tRNA ligase [Deltaproteobacteria bacterium]